MLNLIFAAALLAQTMFGGLPIDGIRCESMEGAVEHVHSRLQIFDRGKSVQVPPNIGIQGGSCLYWVHTHAADGIIHIESPVSRKFTLGEFFDIWGQPLSRARAGGLTAGRGQDLRFTVNGLAWKGDPRAIPLRDREEIVIRRGPPF